MRAADREGQLCAQITNYDSICAGASEYVSLSLGCSCGATGIANAAASASTLAADSVRGADGVARCSSDLDGACWSCTLDAQYPPSPPRKVGSRGALRGGLSGGSCQTLSAQAVPCDANSGLL